MTSSRGRVTLIGAGPGDPGLLTLAGLRALRRADVVIHDRLVSAQILQWARSSAELIDAGKSPGGPGAAQEHIHALLIDHARRGRRVVRLKGGDPFIFGRGQEEVDACRAAGIPCRVIPGVTSALAGPAAAGIALTDRRCARTVALVTGRTAEDLGTAEATSRYRAIAHADTIVILMSRGTLRDSVAAILAAGRDPQTPAAAIHSATTPAQRVVHGRLENIADAVERAALKAPLLVVIGAVAASAEGATPPRKGPLAGRRIVLTRPRSTNADMTRLLRRAGAVVLPCPLIRISYEVDHAPLDAALDTMNRYSWLALTSQHAVRAVAMRLSEQGWDARILASTRIAAMGPATARALRRMGLRADFVPTVHTGAALIAEWAAAHPLRRATILYPRADIAGTALAERLRAHGAIVTDVIAYATVHQTPPAWAVAELQRGADAIVFASPSAARSYHALRLTAGSAKIACLGPTTASAARDLGLHVDATAADHHAGGMVEALASLWAERVERG